MALRCKSSGSWPSSSTPRASSATRALEASSWRPLMFLDGRLETELVELKEVESESRCVLVKTAGASEM